MRKASFLAFLFSLATLCFGQAGGRASDPTTAAAQAGALAAGKAGGGSAMAADTGTNYGERAILALSNADYPITPGDVYALTFLKASTPERLSVVVEGDGAINFGFFGRIAAGGMRFRDLKTSIEKKVAESYPGSSPSLLIASTGVFQVKVEGEVGKAGLATAWGLTRLSELLSDMTTYASIRDIRLVRSDTSVLKCDLFRAQREGDLSQDPYLKPGDRVIIGRYARSVLIQGAVERPGTYQLLPPDDLKQLVSLYGGGLLPTARPELGILRRRAETGRPAGETAQIDLRNSLELIDGDTVYVPAADSFLDVVYIEGAIEGPVSAVGASEDSAKVNIATEYRVERYPFTKGERLSSVLRGFFPRLSLKASLRQGFVQRPGWAEPIPVDMEALIYRYDAKKDLELNAGDRIVIPFGAFEVFVTGEATKSSFVNISGLTRLRQVTEPFLTPYSSIRVVTVISSSGDKASYDLFKANRNGDLSQDPILKPGDRVLLTRLTRSVSIAGAVERPGTYQLLSGEGLRELIEQYGGGFNERADKSRIDLIRYINAKDPAGERLFLEYLKGRSFPLENHDVVTVPTFQDLSPVVFFEGAVNVGEADKEAKVEPGVSNRFPYRFYSGELLANAIKSNEERFTAEADLASGYILRKGTRMPIDFSKYLYDKEYRDSERVEAGDILVIPFKQYFVTVGGAVTRPGRYPFVPDRGWRYYVGLAGGADPDKNSGNARSIFDREGKEKGSDAEITPEDSIVLASNSLLHIFGRFAGIFTTLLSVASLVVALWPKTTTPTP